MFIFAEAFSFFVATKIFSMLIKVFKFLFKLIGWLILILLVIFFFIYALAPVYNFEDYTPFSGEKIYNPYEGMDSTAWKKGNFQVQSRAWWGITAGRGNTNEAIQTIYKQLGYDIIVTSDYMKINTFQEDQDSYIPTYEHGYGVLKTHQICFGSERVCWLDYPLFQSLSHKQHILNLLRDDNKLVALAHPQLRGAYTLEEMHYLTNYDLIEVLNELQFSVGHWDAALSSGHTAFIIANDDAHDIFDPSEVGRVITFINTQSLHGDSVLHALKTGNAYGVDIVTRHGDDFVQKAKDHREIPFVTHVEVKADTLLVGVSESASLISFIGQNGVVKKTVPDTSAGYYKIQPGDSYIRTEVTFENGTRFYLNPVIRYNGRKLPKLAQPTLSHGKTWVQRGVAFIIALIIMLIVIRVRKRRVRRKKIRRRYYY